MTKLIQNVNRKAITEMLYNKASLKYKNSWKPEYAVDSYMEGVNDLFDMLKMPSPDKDNANIRPVVEQKLNSSDEG